MTNHQPLSVAARLALADALLAVTRAHRDGDGRLIPDDAARALVAALAREGITVMETPR